MFCRWDFPVCFKQAIISLIPKNKTPYNFLFENIQDNINPNQFGFRPIHSTTHCLIFILDTVFKHLELNSSYVEAVFADIIIIIINLLPVKNGKEGVYKRKEK